MQSKRFLRFAAAGIAMAASVAIYPGVRRSAQHMPGIAAPVGGHSISDSAIRAEQTGPATVHLEISWAQQARAILAGSSDSATREKELRELLASWAAEDPEAAGAFAASLP